MAAMQQNRRVSIFPVTWPSILFRVAIINGTRLKGKIAETTF
jgi:hypothetical protein